MGFYCMYNDSVGVGMAIFVYLVMLLGNFTYIYVVFFPVYQFHYGETESEPKTDVKTDPPYSGTSNQG